MREKISLLGRPFPGLRVDRIILASPIERLPGEGSLAYVQRMVKEKRVVALDFKPEEPNG
jgi:hypothetical protein